MGCLKISELTQGLDLHMGCKKYLTFHKGCKNFFLIIAHGLLEISNYKIVLLKSTQLHGIVNKSFNS